MKVSSSANSVKATALGLSNSLLFFVNIELIDRSPLKVTYFHYQEPSGEPLSAFWKQSVYL